MAAQVRPDFMHFTVLMTNKRHYSLCVIVGQDGIRRGVDGAVHSVPPDKGCEVLDEELIHE